MEFFRLLHRVRAKWRWWRWHYSRRRRETITIASRQGIFTIATDAEDPISRSLYFDGHFELDHIGQTLTCLRELGLCPSAGQGTVVDVGANIGVISIGMLHTGQFARAIAIEPEPRNFSLLERNVRQNKLDKRMVCLPVAVSDHQGTVEFELSADNYGDHRVRTIVSGAAADAFGETARRVISVPARRLDDLLAELPSDRTQDIALVWMDVQGHEGNVLRGARQLLSRRVPVVAEFWPYGLARSGTSRDDFRDLARQVFTSFWALRQGRYVRHPIDALDRLFDELPGPHDFENLIFV
jgi:FkbM family methyltransferase